MSAISGYISQIQTAVYGEQVRSSIVNALLACYSDVENPDLQSAAFQTAIEAAYQGGFLDIAEVTQVSQMTNENIIYRYMGTESGYVANTLYYHNGTAWVPLGSGVLSASTAAQMTNTDAIYKYIGSETGYKTNALYYYNGTAWALISEDLTYTTEEFETASTNLFDPSTMVLANTSISDNGLVSSSGTNLAVVPVTPGKYYTAQAKTNAWSSGKGFALLDSSKTALYITTASSTINSEGYSALNEPVIFTAIGSASGTVALTADRSGNGICFKAPTGVSYVAVKIKTSSDDSTTTFMLEEGQTANPYSSYSDDSSLCVSELLGHEIADKYLRGNAVQRSSFGAYEGTGKNIFDVSSMMVQGYVSNDGIVTNTTRAHAEIPIVGESVYSIQKKYSHYVGNGRILLLDESKNIIYNIEIKTETANGDYYYPTSFRVYASTGRASSDISVSADNANKGVTIQTQEDCAYLAFNLAYSTPYAKDVMVEIGPVCTAYEPYSSGSGIASIDGRPIVDAYAREKIEEIGGGGGSLPYDGMTWSCLGDSITASTSSGGGSYVQKTASALGFTVNNVAENGVEISAGVSQAGNITNATKLVTVMLGTNNSEAEYSTDAVIGQVGDTGTSTIHGQIYRIINTVLTNHPNVVLGFITPIPRFTDAQARTSVRRVAEAIKEACEYYSIPCLDLQTSSLITDWTESIYLTDHLHPSINGAELIAKRVESWIKTIL